METIAETLQDIVEKIQINSHHVSHVDYPSNPPSSEFIQRFEQLSIEIQHRYLQSELQDLLYRVYFSREVAVSIEPNAPLINNRVQGSDLQFIETLKQSNAGTGYYDRGWKIVQQEPDGMLAVQKSGLRLHIPPNRRLEQSTSVGDVVL
ncbi:MAG: hypothetical protein MUC48_23895 [Leptolyngbya sp. Prado105]|nr:hypothetical protein [Leptolyngbya sp. Prado105]